MDNTLNKTLKRRLGFLGLTVVSMGAGLLSRSPLVELPEFLALYSGDTIWAMMVFFLVCAVFPHWKIRQAAGVAIVFAFAIEFSQLYHAPWIDGIRQNTLGGLVLGFGFKVSDLVCYVVGVGLGCLGLRSIPRMLNRSGEK
ncbi:hypothetical protein A9Q99_14205 [Gammaproteobacteria bacterium 45_16_T64]|nr:hypothetical protein A9Q99_14205 [Gammaproteobacteria bacterium 45_16_T64]